MNKLGTKRQKAGFLIFGTALTTSTTSTAPTPTLEIPKQVAIGVIDVAMCNGIFQIYFDNEDELTEESIIHFLKEAGLVTVVSGLVAYTALKITQGIHDEFQDLIGGWLISGLLTGSETVTIGLLFWIYCDRRYRKMNENKFQNP